MSLGRRSLNISYVCYVTHFHKDDITKDKKNADMLYMEIYDMAFKQIV